jgi:hypothetical protein
MTGKKSESQAEVRQLGIGLLKSVKELPLVRVFPLFRMRALLVFSHLLPVYPKQIGGNSILTSFVMIMHQSAFEGRT